MFNERIQSLILSVQMLSSFEANGASLEQKLMIDNVKEINGITYIQFDELMAECGLVFTALYGNIIITDGLFEELSDNAKSFLILHEIGHAELNHLSQLAGMTQEEIYNTRVSYINQGEVMPMELEADKFAASRITTECAKKALAELIEVQYKNCIYDMGEMQNRIKALN